MNPYQEPEKKTRKPKKPKPIGKPLKEIQRINNPDKIGAESWNPKRAKNLANFPSPSRILLLGPCGVGKSTLIKNLVMHQKPMFQDVYLIHEDAGVTGEYRDLECTAEFNEVPGIDFWNYDGPFRKRAVICDDIEMCSANKERLKNLAIMFRYASTHKGLTIYFAHQSFFDIMPLIKKMANVYILWKPRSSSEITMIENRTGLKKNTLKDLFKTTATEHRSSICIDMTENSPAKLRLDIWKAINQSDSDSEEEDS